MEWVSLRWVLLMAVDGASICKMALCISCQHPHSSGAFPDNKMLSHRRVRNCHFLTPLSEVSSPRRCSLLPAFLRDSDRKPSPPPRFARRHRSTAAGGSASSLPLQSAAAAGLGDVLLRAFLRRCPRRHLRHPPRLFGPSSRLRHSSLLRPVLCPFIFCVLAYASKV